jgi:hypothetical protein
VEALFTGVETAPKLTLLEESLRSFGTEKLYNSDLGEVVLGENI